MKEVPIKDAQDAVAIVRSVLGNICSDLGISTECCKISAKEVDGDHVPNVMVRFVDEGLNKKVLNGTAKYFGHFGIADNLRKTAEEFFSGITIYLLANKYKELHLLREVIDSGDHFYVMLNCNPSRDSQLYKLFEMTKATCNYGIYSIKKDALLAYCMFYDGNI